MSPVTDVNLLLDSFKPASVYVNLASNFVPVVWQTDREGRTDGQTDRDVNENYGSENPRRYRWIANMVTKVCVKIAKFSYDLLRIDKALENFRKKI